METGHQMPFGIGFVADLLGLSQGTGAADRESFYIACPFCQRKRKLNINLKRMPGTVRHAERAAA